MPGTAQVTTPEVEADAAAGDGPRATAREWAGLILLALPCLLVSLTPRRSTWQSLSPTVALRPSATELLSMH